MKLITVLLSLYIFILSATPCVDIEVESVAHETVAHSEGKGQHSHDKDTDLCSPFCICSCCGQVTLTYLPTIIYAFPGSIEQIQSTNSIYTSALHSNFYGSIWQPPQIV